MTVRVGLSGGIGSGKSSVAEMWRELGATLVDADAIVHELQAPGAPLLDVIRAEFGDEIFDASGALDRKALGRVVFADPAARKRLGEIVHPRVRAEMAARVQLAENEGASVVVLDIPLLFEGRATSAQKKPGDSSESRGAIAFDATVLVYVPRAIQIERTVARDECSREEAEQRIAAQMPIEDKRPLADHIIDNSGSVGATRDQVETLHRRLLQET